MRVFFLNSFLFFISFYRGLNKCLLKQFTVHSGLPHPDNKAAITLSPLLRVVSSWEGFSPPPTLSHVLPTVVNKTSEALPSPYPLILSLAQEPELFSSWFPKSLVNSMQHEGLVGKQSRLLTFNPSFIKANLKKKKKCGFKFGFKGMTISYTDNIEYVFCNINQIWFLIVFPDSTSFYSIMKHCMKQASTHTVSASWWQCCPWCSTSA